MISLRFLSWDTNMADGKVARKQSHVSENTLYKNIFAWFMAMREKEIFARAA